jgi:hypothetical protein
MVDANDTKTQMIQVTQMIQEVIKIFVFQEKNPITGVKEPSFPQSIRYKRIAAGTGLILIMVTLRNVTFVLFLFLIGFVFCFVLEFILNQHGV